MLARLPCLPANASRTTTPFTDERRLLGPTCADTHRIGDSFQHLKITGIPYCIVSNLNERSSTRSFLDDPYVRLERRDAFIEAVKPSDYVVGVLETLMRCENVLV